MKGWVTRMSKTNISREQAIQGLFSLGTKVNWEQIPVDVLQAIIDDKDGQTGPQFTAFLKNRGKMVIGEPKIIPIDRSKPFDVEIFIGAGWKIETQDDRALTLKELDLSKVQFVDMLQSGESAISGEEKQKRLAKAGYVRLDAKIFLTLWENQALIPSSWKEPIGGNTRYIYFDGTILHRPSGYRYVLYLYWRDGQWYWRSRWLGHDWDAGDPSVVLAS